MPTDSAVTARAIESLEGYNVEVTAGPILKDTIEKPLTRGGARAIIDHLLASGFDLSHPTVAVSDTGAKK